MVKSNPMNEKFPLSPREQEILQLAAKGLTNREIAQKLQISPNTVKVHLSNIFEKTGAASRTEAALYGMEQGIVKVDLPGGESTGAPPEPSLWETLLQFRWVWVAIGMLVLVLVLTITTNLILPPSPEPVSPSAAESLAARWQALAPMPEGRESMAVVAYDGNVFSIAGEGPAGIGGEVFHYLLEVNRWETLSAKPTPVADVAGVVIGEKVYVPGGRVADGQMTDVLEVYDPRSDTWASGVPLPKPVSAYALADFEGKLYLFGGWDGERTLADVLIYDPGTDSWEQGTPMATPVRDARAVALTDKIVVLGGQNDGKILQDTLVYYPSRDVAGEDPWGVMAEMPVGRSAFGAASIYESVYVIGGVTAEPASESVGWVLTEAGEWMSFGTIQDFTGRQTEMVSLGSLLMVLDPASDRAQTEAWTYQAFYYSIYIPIIP